MLLAYFSCISTSTRGCCASTKNSSLQLSISFHPSFWITFSLTSESWINFLANAMLSLSRRLFFSTHRYRMATGRWNRTFPFHCARIHSRISRSHCRFIPAAACLLLLSALMYSFKPGSLGRISFIPFPHLSL